MAMRTVYDLLDRVSAQHYRHAVISLAGRAAVTAAVAVTLVRTIMVVGWGFAPAALLVALFLVAFATRAIAGYPGRMSLIAAARYVDRRLDLKDRLATAVEWEARTSRIVPWLIEDAKLHARFAKAEELAPRLWPVGRRALWGALTLLIAAALWVAPLPAGIFARPEPASRLLVTEEEEIEAILDSVASLREQLRALSGGEIERIERDLAELQSSLRDRSLPKDEAVALLRHLERRVESVAADLRDEFEPLSAADLDRIQNLAEQLRPAEILPRNPRGADDGMAIPYGAGRAGDPGGADSEQSDETTRADAADGSDGTGGDDPDASASPVGASAGTGGESALPIPGDGGHGELSPVGGDGAGAGDGVESFERLGGERILEHLTGQSGSGPLRGGQVQTSLQFDDAPEVGDLPLQAGAAPGEPGAGVLRENIPLAHRHLVRRYFQELEPEP